jgi:histidine triad (HIT) family protein
VSDSVFTKIIKGEIPSHKVYEDDYAIAFMDIHPIQTGHVVVAGKTPVATFLDQADEDTVGLWRAVRAVGAKLKKTFPDKKHIAVVFEGLDVSHVHANLYPFDNHDEFIAAPPQGDPNHQELERIAEQLRAA